MIEAEATISFIMPEKIKDPTAFIQTALSNALNEYHVTHPDEPSIDNVKVESIDVPENPNPHCPKCDSQEVVPTMAGGGKIGYHCYDCGNDFIIYYKK